MRPGGRLALFHPIGRAALAARHQRALRPDELLDPTVLPDVLAASGWVAERIDDADHRYLALASRISPSGANARMTSAKRSSGAVSSRSGRLTIAVCTPASASARKRPI